MKQIITMIPDLHISVYCIILICFLCESLCFLSADILTAYLVVAAFFCTFITFYTGDWLVNFLKFCTYPEPAMAGMVFCAAVVSFAVCFVWEVRSSNAI